MRASSTGEFEMMGLTREVLAGVVRMVALTPWLANNLAMLTMGSMWPGAIYGKKRM